ncbi:hypothetical protein CBR_g31800 [Chara braunii]|uniref:Uncharacterized protein n=1 Tax=Chara braunii TaxID=69332 RepID=A0A388LFP0_CHABU|nr:hypothetical protein CBR_g31800 [Chara braunii]|eukprot:GBG81124.1 hypothetical protein CBR_g31800 [Chara braunii]
MMRLFNYIVSKSENREAKEWKDGNFFDYEKEEERFGAKAAEWDEERDRIPLEYARRVPKRLGGEQEEKGLKGAGLKATRALYRDAPFHFKYFVYHAIRRVDLLIDELRRLKNAALNLSWEKKQRWSTLLPVNMRPKELLPAADEIVTAATNFNCKAAILDLANPKECFAWSPTDFDALHKTMTKLCGDNWILIDFAPRKQHKIVIKQLYNWDNAEVIPETWKHYIRVGTAVSKYGNWQVDYKDMMAVVVHAEGGELKKVTRAPKLEAELVELNVEEEHFKRCTARHSGKEENEREVGAFAMFMARCKQLKFTTNQAMQTYDEYSNIAKTNDAWNPIESNEETETSDLEIEDRMKRNREGMESVRACSVPKDNQEEGCTKSGGVSSPTRDVTDRASSIEQMQTDSLTLIQALENILIHDNRQGFQRRTPSRENTDNEMLADADEDDLMVPNALPKLMPGDDIPDRIVQFGGQSTTHFATSVVEAMSQTAIKIMEVDKGTRNIDKDPSNVASYGPPLITQTENESASQTESLTPSTNMAVGDEMQEGGYADRASEVQKDSDEMMKVLEEVEKEAKRKLEGSTTSQTVINCISYNDEGLDVHAEGSDDNEDARKNVDEQKGVDDEGRPARRSTRKIKRKHPINV